MPTSRVTRPDAQGRVTCVGQQRSGRRLYLSRSARLSQFKLLMAATCFGFGLALVAQTSDSQMGDTDKSWTATTESQSDNTNPTRSSESHTQSGNRTLDTQSVQRLGTDGHFEPYQDIEKETVKVDATTVRTITRAFARDANGAKTLVQVTEEEKHTLPGGDSNV